MIIYFTTLKQALQSHLESFFKIDFDIWYSMASASRTSLINASFVIICFLLLSGRIYIRFCFTLIRCIYRQITSRNSRFFWHSPQLKQGDSCFNHYCIVWYHAVSQCLTQCPQARLYCFRMPYGAVLFMLMLTAFAVLCLKYLCLRWYPCYVWYGSLDIPILGLLDFLPADSCTHSRNKSDCLDTLLALWLDHFYTRQTYI